MSNIKVIIEGIEKEFKPIDVYSSYGDLLFKNKWYREVEPVKQDYEIQSFRNMDNSKGVYFLNARGYTGVGENMYDYSLKDMMSYVEAKAVEMFSVKRLSDGEVFTVGDDVKHIKRDDTWKVEKIEIDGCTIRISAWYYYVILKYAVKIKQPTILLKTEDGVDIVGDKGILCVLTPDFKKHYCSAFWVSKFPDAKYFSTEAARDEYILQNKPVTVTLKELIDRIIFKEAQIDLLTQFFKSIPNNKI